MPISTPQIFEDSLPSDLQACHKLIRELAFLLENKDSDSARLKEQLQNMMRGKFGRSTEKLSADQLSLFRQQLEDLVQAADEKRDECNASDNLDIVKPNALNKKNGGGGRKPISASVKRLKKHHRGHSGWSVCGNLKVGHFFGNGSRKVVHFARSS